MFTRWANTYLQHSLDQFLITDLARDLGDGITLLSLVEMLGGFKYRSVARMSCSRWLDCQYPVSILDIPGLQITKVIKYMFALRACLHGGGGPQVGEVARLGGVTRLSI